jgi:hypothetical protein
MAARKKKATKKKATRKTAAKKKAARGVKGGSCGNLTKTLCRSTRTGKFVSRGGSCARKRVRVCRTKAGTFRNQ